MTHWPKGEMPFIITAWLSQMAKPPAEPQHSNSAASTPDWEWQGHGGYQICLSKEVSVSWITFWVRGTCLFLRFESTGCHSQTWVPYLSASDGGSTSGMAWVLNGQDPVRCGKWGFAAQSLLWKSVYVFILTWEIHLLMHTLIMQWPHQ